MPRSWTRPDVLPTYRQTRWDRSNGKVYPFPLEEKWYPDIWSGRKMTEYIQSYDSDAPAMLWLSFSGPHYPFDAPEAYYDRVDMDALEKKGRTGCTEISDPDRIHYKSYHGGGNIDGCGPSRSRLQKLLRGILATGCAAATTPTSL